MILEATAALALSMQTDDLPSLNVRANELVSQPCRLYQNELEDAITGLIGEGRFVFNRRAPVGDRYDLVDVFATPVVEDSSMVGCTYYLIISSNIERETYVNQIQPIDRIYNLRHLEVAIGEDPYGPIARHIALFSRLVPVEDLDAAQQERGEP